MELDINALKQIAYSLADHYLCVYYVNINSGRYIVFTGEARDESKDSDLPAEGEDFFADTLKNAPLFTHPDDMEIMNKAYDKKTLLARLNKDDHYSISFRTRINGEIRHMRHVVILCRDKRHAICCLEDVEAEYQEKQEQIKNLQSEKLLARTDELTGVKNGTAFKEYVDRLDQSLKDEEQKGAYDTVFAIIMCDINDLKQTNDTKGHSSGDKEIQATSKLICDTFQHSPVFRIGGDEFVVILTGKDYEQRDLLMKAFKDVLSTNRKAQKGPNVACGLAFFEPEKGDRKFLDVFRRADSLMYEDKKATKAAGSTEDPGQD